MEADNPSSVSGYYKCLAVLGGAHFLGGVAALGLGIANAIICGMLGSIGYGIWGSVIYFIAGATGIMAAVRQTRGVVATHMIFAIIAACTATVQLGMGVGSAVADYSALKASNGGQDLGHFLGYQNRTGGGPQASDFSPYYGYSNGLDYFFRFGCSAKQRNTYWTYQASGPTVTDSLLAAFAIIEGLVALMSAIYTCRICICPPGITWMAYQPHHGQMHVTSKA